MVEPIASNASSDALSVFMAQQRGPLLAGPEWSALQALDALRPVFDGFLGGLDAAQKLEYVRLQRAWIDAQKALEKSIRQLTEAFKQQALMSLRTELKTLTGQDIDPTVAKIHTRYLQSSGRSRRAAQDDEVIKVASVSLWDAACMNYDGLTGWSYPGRTGLADASYLDAQINASAADFIALVRRLDMGGQLRTQLDQALRADASLGGHIMALANAEFEFALIEALNNPSGSRIDAHKYGQVKRALGGEVRWKTVEEMLLFIPHGVDNISWIPQRIGLTGQYQGAPPGDTLSIPHIVFSVADCPGAFSFFPNRPGGSLRHHASHREACDEFHVAFDGFYRNGIVDWLYQVMLLRDCARLSAITRVNPPPKDLNPIAELLYALSRAIPKTNNVQNIGYVRREVQNMPVVSLSAFYIKRCRGNLQELANETPGLMPTLIEVFETLFNEILNLLLIPVPGTLKGLGRVRAFAMFVALGRGLIAGGYQALQGEPGELLQTYVDLADLLISGRLHSRLAITVQRRHQRLYQQLAQRQIPGQQGLTNPQLLERMLGAQGAPARDMDVVLAASGTSRQALNQVWDGGPVSASLAEAVQRFRADRLIDWVAEGADPGRPAPEGAFEVMAPLLIQLQDWPANTALRIENPQGLELRRYSKDAMHLAPEVVTVTALENYQFAYATPQRRSAHLPEAIAALLPGIFAGAEQTLRGQLADFAKALRVDLFDALTRFAEVSRSMPMGAGASVRRLLPDSVGSDHPVPAVITQLRALHPDLSLARLLEVLREHPLSPHQQTQLLETQLQPEALYHALRAARRLVRCEALIDGLFHPRRFDPQTQQWAQAFAPGVLRDVTEQTLVVCPAGQAVPYVSRRPGDRTVVVIDQRQGRFSSFDPREQRSGPIHTGADSFYAAIMGALSAHDRARLGATTPSAIADFRAQVAHAMLRNRAPDGTFYPARRDITQYAFEVDTSAISAEPDALGLYRLEEDRYLFIEGEYFQIAQADAHQPWRVQHPSLIDAYAPALSHNGAGAWRHEWETPLAWDGQKPFYRLGPWVRSVSPDAIEQIQRISGVTGDLLRRVHVRNERPPVMLANTLERFHIHRRVKAGVEAGRDFFDQLIGEVGPDAADVLVGQAGASRVDQVTVLASKVQLDKPQMERLFFKALAHESELSAHPLAQVIQRQFPSLTAAFADDCVRSATPAELQSLQAGRVPAGLTKEASWYIRYLRMTRAIEGLHWSAAANPDSSRLILHSLEKMPGWPAHLRVEVWDSGVQVDSVGPADAPLRSVLQTVTGAYQAYTVRAGHEPQATGNRGPFLDVLLAALTPAERQSLGYDYDDGAQVLLEEMASRVQHHFGLVETLLGILHQPWFKPPRRLADGRIGYPLSGGDEWGPTDREQIARMRQLYPSKTDQQVFEMLESRTDSVRERDEAIDYLFRERDALDASLERWCLLGPAEIWPAQREAAERIRRCWRQEDSGRGVLFELVLDDLGLSDLPPLNVHFGHVMQLSLRNNQLQAVPAQLLRRFPALRTLLLDGNRLEHIPHGLVVLQHLQYLTLSHNRIKPDLWDVRRLGELKRLTKLDLSHNPLGWGQRLNVYGLTALKRLHLRNTLINILPRGAVTLPRLETFDLRDNHLKVLTEYDLYLDRNVHGAMMLQGNELSQGTLQVLSRYRQRPGYQNVHFGLWHDGAFPLPSIDRWLAVIPLDQVAQHRALWSQLAVKQTAQDFFNLLWNIGSYPPLIASQYQALRQDITRRVWQLIGSAVNSARLERILLEAPLKYMAGRMDGWLLCLNDLELQLLPVQMLVADVDVTSADFLNYYRARRRIESINYRITRDYSFYSAVEQSMYLLFCRIALTQALDLPVPLTMSFASSRVVGPRSLNELHRLILAEEVQINWSEELKGEEYWVEFLQRKYPQQFTSALDSYDLELEQLTDQMTAGTLSENAYKIRMDALGGAMRAAKEDLAKQLTEQEWNAFTSA